MSETDSCETGKPLSKATVLQTLNALRAFILWLAGQPRYRSRISYSDADYFRLSEKETRIAKATRERAVPSLEQIRGVLGVLPRATEIQRRNRAVIAFTLLTGVRDGALASLKLKHIDLTAAKVLQDAREVNTKFSKSFTTWFFPVGNDIHTIIAEWVAYLRDQKLWGGDDPLFPATKVVNGTGLKFEVSGLARRHWSNAGPIRAIFWDAFTTAGLTYFNPHSFRKTLAQLGERVCRTPEELKAWSQNLGHEDVMTTLRSYGEVPSSRQAEIIRNLRRSPAPDMDVAAALKALETNERRADDAGTKLDKVLSCLDGMSARMDAVERMEKSRGDAARKADAADEDGADEGGGLDEPDFGEARRLAADGYGHPATLAADAVKADAQMRCEAVAGMFGRQAPKPMDGETPRNYRVRLLMPYVHNSVDYKDLSKEDLRALPPKALDIAERRIYADAMAASASPTVAPGYLHMVRRPDETGRLIVNWYGQPRAWMQQFMPPTRRVAQFHMPSWGRSNLG
jgi:integrase